jgi:hypothetical protein
MLTILDPNYLEQRADQIRRQNDRRRRHRLDRAVVGRFDSVSSSATRERLAPTPTVQSDIPGASPGVMPIAQSADVARVHQFEQAALQRAARAAAADLRHPGPVVDFRGDGFLSD